uniref:Succinate dehydrogenase [ubiquinone] cytochrome b small subunit n=1 Tax=Zymoseptoria tritici TaxID=1047171 RepID=G4XX50_ZYMTR|nr:mitochondrial succinate dehydrogenase subunit D [Zymoseptoria tritici]
MASTALRPAGLRQLLTATTTKRASTLPAASLLRTQFTQRSGFQTTARRPILPPLPQVIRGGVNDPAPVKEPSPSHGSYHWTMERLVSAALIPLTIVPFAAGSLNPVLDGTFIGMIIIHSYIGFQSAITDYFPSWRVPKTRKLADWANVAAVFLVGWGWYEFETNDIGLTAGIARVWTAGATAKDAKNKIEQKL